MEKRSGEVLELKDLVEIAKSLVTLLEGKVFDIVSYHSRLNYFPMVVESRQLKSREIVVIDTLVKLLLSPSRSLSFDLKEKPEIIMVSDRQIIIVRHLSPRDTVTRVILINEKKSEND